MEGEEGGQTIWERGPVGEVGKSVVANNIINLASSLREDFRVVHHREKEVTNGGNSLDNIRQRCTNRIKCKWERNSKGTYGVDAPKVYGVRGPL